MENPMNSVNPDKSENRLPCFTDWHRYDTPTVLRKHGREYLERFWRDSESRPPQRLTPVVEHLATLQGGEIIQNGEPMSLRVELHLTRRVAS
jgi:hypothetical protein